MGALRLLYCGRGWFEIVDAIRLRLPRGVNLVVADQGRPIAEQVSEADIILPSNAGLSAEMISRAQKLALVQQPAVGVDGIDLAAAKLRQIPVCSAPAANGNSVAQAALLLILALARRQKAAQVSFMLGRVGEPAGMELDGKVLLIVGRGRSGRALEDYARALHMRVLALDSKSSTEDLERALPGADFVSLHCPLTHRTRNLFDAALFSKMKRGAHLINCARGPIIDRSAMEEALASGRLAGAGLDTFWEEPWQPNDPLYTSERVVTLPHVGGSTLEAFARVADVVAENVRRLRAHEPLLHRVI